MNWVKLKKYCHQTGETHNAVHARRQSGVWKDGVHCKIVANRLWVNLDAVKDWIEGRDPSENP